MKMKKGEKSQQNVAKKSNWERDKTYIFIYKPKLCFLLNFESNFMLCILFFSIFEQKNIEKAYFDQRLEYAAPKHRSKYTTLIFVETYALTNKNCIFLLLLVSLLRLSQRKDDPVEVWLKPFYCHNTFQQQPIGF